MHFSITFILALAVYTKTLMPSIPGGDSGELVAEACELGTAHPPGYPLYTMVVHLLTYIPYGTMAWRANELCAILGALAAANIAQCVFMLTSNTFSMIPTIFENTSNSLRQAASICAGLLYAFSPLVWTYSVGSEVFAMNNFFASLLIVLTIKFASQNTNEKRFSSALLGSFICGIGMCNQHTQILFQIPLIVFVIYTLRNYVGIKQIVFLGVSYIIGLLPYIYLPINSIYFPKRGAWGDMSSWTGFFRHLRRADYGTFQLYSGGGTTEGLTERLSAHGWDYAERQSLWGIGSIFSLMGLWVCLIPLINFCTKKNNAKSSNSTGVASIRKANKEKKEQKGKRGGKGNKGNKLTDSYKECDESTVSDKLDVQVQPTAETANIGGAIVSFFIFYEIGFHSLSNLPLDNKLLFGIHARFWMQPNIILFIWLGIGIIWLSNIISNVSKVYTVTNSFMICISIGLVILQLFRWSSDMDQSENRYLEQYARGILESLPPKSLFFTNYDQQWTASRYLHVCENVRKDIPFINLSMMTFWWFYRQRMLFPEIHFPKRCTNEACGAYLAGDHTPQYKRGEAFTFKELLDANIHKFPGGIYIGGEVGAGAEGGYRDHYEDIPYGLLKRIVPKNRPYNKLEYSKWIEGSNHAWKQIHTALPALPSVEKYNEETWEWTVGKDYWDHRATSAAYKLEMVSSPKNCGPVCGESVEAKERELHLLIEAANSLEEFILKDPVGPSPAMVKNAGIAYSKMIQGKFPEKVKNKLQGTGYPFLESTRALMFEQKKYGDWSEHASYRTLNLWSKFINMEGSEKDPSYENVKRIVEYLKQTDKGKPKDSPTVAATPEKKKMKKKKKKKKKRKSKKKKKSEKKID